MKLPCRARALLLALLLASPFVAAADDPRRPALPPDAIGYAGDPAPSDTTMVSPREWDGLLRNPKFHRESVSTRADQKKVRTRQRLEDEALLRLKERQLRRRFLPKKPVFDANNTPLKDGNIAHRLRIAGEDRSYVTLGYDWMIHALANSFREFPQRRNQIQIYSAIYGALDDATRRRLQLIHPGEITDNTPDRVISELNARLVSDIANLVRDFNGIPLPQFEPRACGHDEGDRTFGDQVGNRDFCTADPDGILRQYDFPARRFLTCVKDQANRGTCTAFATTSAIEYHVRRSTPYFVNLSEQSLYNRVKFNYFRQDFGDGAWAGDVFSGMEGENFTLPYEEQWAYNPSLSRTMTATAYESSCTGYDDTCSNTTHQGGRFCADIGIFRFCGYIVPEKNPLGVGARVTTHAQLWDATRRRFSTALMALAVIFRNPVAWGFAVTPSFDSQRSGYVTYNPGEGNRGGHSVHVVGYISKNQLDGMRTNAPASPEDGYFIIKNSWSNCFGDGGYVYVPWSFVEEYTSEMIVLHGARLILGPT